MKAAGREGEVGVIGRKGGGECGELSWHSGSAEVAMNYAHHLQKHQMTTDSVSQVGQELQSLWFEVASIIRRRSEGGSCADIGTDNDGHAHGEIKATTMQFKFNKFISLSYPILSFNLGVTKVAWEGSDLL